MTELEKCLAGLPFEGDDPEIGRMALQTKRLLKEPGSRKHSDEAFTPVPSGFVTGPGSEGMSQSFPG